jgi:uncharacterized membrane protein
MPRKKPNQPSPKPGTARGANRTTRPAAETGECNAPFRPDFEAILLQAFPNRNRVEEVAKAIIRLVRTVGSFGGRDRKLAQLLWDDEPFFKIMGGLLSPEHVSIPRELYDLLVKLLRPDSELASRARACVLQPTDVAILKALAEAKPRAVVQADLEARTNLSRRTIGPRLAELRKWGLVCRPHGPRGRKGDMITDQGMTALDAYTTSH